MKIGCILTLIFFISFLVLTFNEIKNSNFFKIDFCLDRGYCWDYNRNRCEEKDPGYCIKNQKRCDEVSGIWNEKEKYCKLPF